MGRTVSPFITLTLALTFAPSMVGAQELIQASLSVGASDNGGLPIDGPAALHAPESVPPGPEGWIFPEEFPRTSGTQRLAEGALYWSGFLYDDHGALGLPVGPQTGLTPTVLSPTVGTFVYPAGAAHNNGADIAAAAVGTDGTDVWFRVDWQTLADPAVPIAMWAFDTDDDATTGVAAWPAGAGVRSDGNDAWLLVTGSGAWLVDSAGDRVSLASIGGSSSVGAGSFVARVPAQALPSLDRWSIRLAAGLANGAGDGFAAVPLNRGSLPGQPPIYDVAFRDHEQEPLGPENWWREAEQARALASGDITAFSTAIEWADLLEQKRTPEVLLTGASNRWYYSALDMGPGIAINSASIPGTFNYASDFKASYLGRRQPYSIYVPSDLDASDAAPLTIMLHAINVSHQQFAILNPAFMRDICDARNSICVGPLGRGPDGWWANEAELDVWEVWNRVAQVHRLDPTRTVLTGYSMGGYGAYRLGLEHPDLFAAVLVLAGAPACSIRVVEGTEFPVVANNRECLAESNTSPLIENAEHVPFYLGHDGLDELAPVTSALEQASRFDALGYRHRLEVYPHHDHVSWWFTGTFEGAVDWLERDVRQRAEDPRHIRYSWYAQHQRPELGTGPGSVWWVSGLRAASDEPGFIARVEAVSDAIVQGDPVVDRITEPVVNADGPAFASELLWGGYGAPRERAAKVDVQLTGTAAATFDLARAGFRPCEPGTVQIGSSGPVAVQLEGLAAGVRVRVDGEQSYEAGTDGRVSFDVGSGASTATVDACGAGAAQPSGAGPHGGALPTTGGGLAVSGMLASLGLAWTRRLG